MRIKEIANLINDAEIVIDVGSDHAFLSIELLKQNKAKKVINIDINQVPLNTGIKNLKKNNLLSFTDNVLNDGLKKLKLEQKIDYCVISGLGGCKITNIISEHDLNINNFILVPNNNVMLIRRWALENKYRIWYESILLERNHFYSLIILNKKHGIKVHNRIKDLEFGKINLENKSQNFIQMWTQKYDFIIKQNLSKKKRNLKRLTRIIEREVITKNCHDNKKS